MSKSNTAAEPSMEEILASIRRIIADEDPDVRAKAKPPAEPAAAAPAPPAAAVVPAAAPIPKSPEPPVAPAQPALMPDEDVLDLAMAAVEAEAAAAVVRPKGVEPVVPPDVDFEDEVNEPPPPPITAQLPRAEPAWTPPRPAPAPAPEPQRIVTPNERLLSPERDSEVAAAFGSLSRAVFSTEPRTIEDLTKELLKPMLRDWLDDNLPPLVERLVREEIERVARGRR